ncbi:glycoside hydrolase family 3 N-terminal domain-containing protein [Carnobacterium sp. ISL-102]|uniref:glycoside hydrolase family 3 N-terminal domain-containing protein n=1 Tax=Carnobacterium sp. ISL-102 TaxID=2819142 RepID=UPI001BE73480|nr:glycoside hydrolase family 3 N-terminal domain-containing protein [Carnobacterium sp. ISL-102]MBT2731021.1 glycoside hydrolase family 3 C-terminal domain-containing protein [Carnobacterium sp. ISL-102]
MESTKLKELVNQMTVEEKIGQMIQLSSDFFNTTENEITGPMNEMYLTTEKMKTVGSVLGISGANQVKEIQRSHLESSRLGIPLLFMADIVHGYRTIFPIPLGLASSWDPKLVEQTAAIAAKEAAVAGLHVTFSPMVDLVRDARWGRVMESTGEDAYLNQQMARAFVRGYQGPNLKKDVTKLAACVKHFAAYGAPIAGREYNTVNMSERQLRENYLPAYKAAIDEGSRLVMTAFNTVDGIPATGNSWLMNEVLRKEMGFDGVLISDWGAIGELIAHGVAENLKEAGTLAFEAGVDIEMMSAAYSSELKGLIESGTLDETKLNMAVLRILELKNDLGLFENPYRGADAQKEAQEIFSHQNREAARISAEQSIVLLKNEHVLPLRNDLKIALIGPNSQTHDLLGSWSWKGDTAQTPSLYEGILQHVSAEQLVVIAEADMLDQSANEKLADVDVIVLALGETSEMSGEAASRTSLTLPGNQLELVKAVRRAAKPVVATLFNGRPLDLSAIVEEVDGLVEAWFPGSEGGAALANVLFGAVNPSGKLTMSFPRTIGQVPMYYNQDKTGRPINETNKTEKYLSKYLDVENTPLFPFGFGLSYTKFSYSALNFSHTTVTKDETVTVSVTVKNEGKVAGAEIVQLYIQDEVAKVVRPVKELKRVEKITLEPQAQKEVTFTLTAEALAYVHPDLTFAADNGTFKIMVGSDSETVQSETIRLITK